MRAGGGLARPGRRRRRAAVTMRPRPTPASLRRIGTSSNPVSAGRLAPRRCRSSARRGSCGTLSFVLRGPNFLGPFAQCREAEEALRRRSDIHFSGKLTGRFVELCRDQARADMRVKRCCRHPQAGSDGLIPTKGFNELAWRLVHHEPNIGPIFSDCQRSAGFQFQIFGPPEISHP